MVWLVVVFFGCVKEAGFLRVVMLGCRVIFMCAVWQLLHGGVAGCSGNVDGKGGRYFYEPYHSAVVPIIDTRLAFVLNQLSDSVKLVQHNNLFVVPCTTDGIEP